MTSYIGIDLGTAFSAVATVDATGRPKIIENKKNKKRNITPSCLMIENDKLTVGEVPARRLGDSFSLIASRFKRSMGEKVKVKIGDLENSKEFSPTELSGAVLTEMKKVAEAELGEIAEAVITIPANFMQQARDETMLAAKMAGLNVKHIINEPTAAAFYYAFKGGEDLKGTYAVYDLGGGTFDISIIKVSGANVEVVATEGIGKLGGYDFDLCLRDLVKSKYFEVHGVEVPDDFDLLKLSNIIQKKHELSSKESFSFFYEDIIIVTRDDFEESISALLAQTEMSCEGAILEAGVTIDEIDGVFFAGGSTRIPAVRESVLRIFGKEPISTVDVDEVVALGAALYAAVKSDGEHLSDLQKTSVSQMSIDEIATYYFGTIAVIYNEKKQTEELQNIIIIKKGEKIPCEQVEKVYTLYDSQKAINCKVTRSGSPETDPRFVSVVWEGELDLPEGRPQGQEIEIKYIFDENGMMKCNFLDVESNRSTTVDLDVSSKPIPASDIEKFMVD